MTFPLSGGGYRSPDTNQTLEIIINSCPTHMLDFREVVSFNSPDINGDLEVDLIDVVLFTQDFYNAYNYRSDFNWDGIVDLGDVVALAQAMGIDCQ